MDELRDPQYKSPDGSAIRMWRDTAKNGFLSEKEGRPIFDEVIYVEVISPGSRDSSPVFELVRKFHELSAYAKTPMFGPKYEEYKSFVADFEKAEGDQDGTMAGTPLSQWPEISRTMIAALKTQSVFTVDALAALPDSKLSIVGPDGRTWREKAKAYVENAKSGAYATAIAADLDRTKQDLADALVREKALADRLTALEAAAATGAAPTARGGKKAAVEPSQAAAEAAQVEPIPPGLSPASDIPADII